MQYNALTCLRGWFACAVLAVLALGLIAAPLPGHDRAEAAAAYRDSGMSFANGVQGARKARAEARKRKAKRKYRSAKRKTYKRNRTKQTYGKSKKNRKSYARRKASKKRTVKASAKQKSSKYRKAAKAKKANTKVASLGPAYAPKPQKSLSGGGVRWVASAGCLNGTLKSVVYQVAAKFGPVTVSSTCRSKKRNRRVGGASKSWHLTGSAVDFRVHANHRAAYAYLKSHGSIGGYKHYGGGLFHIDVGPRRTW